MAAKCREWGKTEKDERGRGFASASGESGQCNRLLTFWKLLHRLALKRSISAVARSLGHTREEGGETQRKMMTVNLSPPISISSAINGFNDSTLFGVYLQLHADK